LRRIEIGPFEKFFQNFGALAGVQYTLVWFAKAQADCRINNLAAAAVS